MANKIVLVNNGMWNDEIIMNKEGKYITLRKEGDRKEFRYDLSNNYYEFERITHYKTREDATDIIDMETDATKVTSWFTNCNLVTNDEKFAKMFVAASTLNRRYKSPVRFIANFGHYRIRDLEKWLSRGIEFVNLNEKFAKLETMDITYIRSCYINIPYDTPEDFNKEQLKYLKTLSDKNNGLTSDDIHRVKYNWNPQQYEMGKKLDTILEDPRYQDAFMVTEFDYSGEKEVYNYLERQPRYSYRGNGRTKVLEIMSKWHLDPQAFCNYLLKLNHEAVGVDDMIRNYDDYLEREYEMKGESRAKMNKYPLNWMSYYHKHHFNYRQMVALRRKLVKIGNVKLYDIFSKKDKEFEYKDDKYLIRLPQTVEDIAIEATQQSHCLYDRYTDDIIDGKSLVLFMRDVNNPDESVLTVEVKYGAINQARGHENDDPTPEQEQWLLAWAKKKGLEEVIRQDY